MTHPTTSPADPTAPAPLTHGCIRCGAPVPLDVGLCERCNPLGLKDSSASQVHGMAFLALVSGVIALALIARLSVANVGPFKASIATLAPDGPGMAVSLTVTNQGSAAGRTTCRVSDPADRNGTNPAIIVSPEIGPGATKTFGQTVGDLGNVVRDLAVECVTP